MPTDVRPLHRIAVSHSVTLVNSVRIGDLGSPTPCADWTLADLLAHMTAQHRGFAAAARGFGNRPEVWDVESVRTAVTANPGGTYAEAAEDVLTAFADDAVLAAPFQLPEFGAQATFPGSVAIGFHLVDYVVHGWDVAAALGAPFDLPDEVVSAALPVALGVPDGAARDLSGSPFARAVTDPGSTELHTVLHHLGRRSDWNREHRGAAE